ncbi:glycosyltransferase family 39 protein [Pelotomaculum terephthalicicum JT]|uniref:mannosyltransferase family protein n=1 Tax=Pelotomaculum TaxID=191373 RepID=UPI0009D36D31|nr:MULTISPECIES: mannosyltransferase family protein [Pelotomaculum]MCG9969365.1 glycosyltransferase family 39 protein [Pelotomaculum terephthalicicum JT]OPX87875.1 MAG: Mannosyltransferase (PIG-V) [Pelotomaculum sp. PtaB.Bin117]OPY64046.1 MAG: Mannosyltransferase (PIG-V) [Pelotomaculum sp. PtaU1.Bin065]
MSKEDFTRVGYLYFLNKIYIIFLIWLTRDVLNAFLPANSDGLHPNVIFDSLLHWDAGWFLRIAGQGYDFDSAPFFPMLPFLIRLLTYVVGNGIIAGFLITNIALFIACYFLYIIAKEDFDQKTAAMTVFIMLFFPTAIFFTSIYSESLFLAFALASFYFARRGRWPWAVLLGSCAALSRNIGIVLFFVFLYMQYHENNKRIILKKTIPLLLIPASLSIFMLVLWKYAGDPLAFSHSLNTEFWGYRHFAYPGAGQFLNLNIFFSDSNFYNLFESGMAFLFLYLIIKSFKYLEDKPQLIFLTLGFLIPFSSVVDNLPLGMPRYILVLFPGYIALARLLCKNGLTHVYSVISILVFSAVGILFAAGHWIS